MPFFMVDGKLISPKQAKNIGLESMTAEELEQLGIKRVDVPIKANRVGNLMTASIPEAGANFDAKMLSEGVVDAGFMSVGDLPKGDTGAMFLAEALRANNALPTKQLILSGISNHETVAAYNAGVKAENTLVGNCATKALKALGIPISSYRYEVVRDTLNIIIETGK